MGLLCSLTSRERLGTGGQACHTRRTGASGALRASRDFGGVQGRQSRSSQPQRAENLRVVRVDPSSRCLNLRACRSACTRPVRDCRSPGVRDAWCSSPRRDDRCPVTRIPPSRARSVAQSDCGPEWRRRGRRSPVPKPLRLHPRGGIRQVAKSAEPARCRSRHDSPNPTARI
jgi:hypothetical protein